MSAITSTTTASTGSGLNAWVKRHPLLAYFLIAFLGTWVVILPLSFSQDGYGLFPYTLPDLAFMLIYFGAAFTGPALAAVVVTAIESGRPGVRQLLRRIVQWRVGIGWYLVALFSFLSIWLVTYSLVGEWVPLTNLIQNWQLIFSIFLPMVAFGIFVPSLGEEPGWRGFALPRLQASYGPLLGSAVLGLLHGLWHFPAFIPPLLGQVTPMGFLAFVLTAMAGTFIYTWIFNHSRASILIPILTHSASNAANKLLIEVIPPETPILPWVQAVGPEWLNVIAFGTAAVVLILLTRGRLGYKSNGR